MDLRTLTVCIDRYQYLTALDRTQLQKRELIECIDKPRSTVDRDVRLLESASVVKRTPEGCELTPFGHLIKRMLSELFPAFSNACHAREIINHLPSEPAFPPKFLVDAEIIKAKSHAPEKPVRTICRHIENATSLRSMAPFILESYVNQLSSILDESKDPVELLMTPTAIDRLIASYRSKFKHELETGKLKLIELSEIPFGLFLIEQQCSSETILVMLSERSVVGIIIAQSDLAREWGERIYKKYRTKGEPLRYSQ